MISDMFNNSCTIQHITSSINADGCPIETVASTEVSPCFFNQLSGSKVYVNTVNSHIVSAQLWIDSKIPALTESFDVKFLNGCITSGNIDIKLGSELTVSIAVDSLIETTPELVASAIAAGIYTNWLVTANGDTVNFTALSGGKQIQSVIDTTTTGVTYDPYHYIEVGSDAINDIKPTDKVTYNNVDYWVEAVNDVINMSLGQYCDLSIFS